MDIKRKIDVQVTKTDCFKNITGKEYTINDDHQTLMKVQDILKKAKNKGYKSVKEETLGISKANEEALGLIIGKENYKEIVEALEKLPKFNKNLTVAQIEIYACHYGITFEECVKRFQGTAKK